MFSDIFKDRIQQMSISFGGRTTLVTEDDPEKATDLATKLKDTWSHVFQVKAQQDILANLQKQRPTIFAMEKSFFTKRGHVRKPTLQIHPEDFNLTVPRIFDGQAIQPYKNDRWLKGGANSHASSSILQIGNILDFETHRVGKIYEFIVSPIGDDETQQVFKHICPNIDEQVGEFHFMVSFIRSIKEKEYNILVLIRRPAGQPVIILKVDVNNRDMIESMNPREMETVFNTADILMPDWFEDFLGGQPSE